MRRKSRLTVALIGAAATCAALASGGVTSAHAASTCTWGGTPVEPTGIFTVSTPLTNLPSAGPIDFTAVGQLGGDCTGRMSFFGTLDAGATCADGTFAGTVKGLPGVVRFAGVNTAGIVPSRLYDRNGNIVGSENAQLLTLDNAPFTDCGVEGFIQGNFSSVIELF